MLFETIEAAMGTTLPGDRVVHNGNGHYVVESPAPLRGELVSHSAPGSYTAPVPSRTPMTGRQDARPDWETAQAMTFVQRMVEDVYQARENGRPVGLLRTAVAALYKRRIIR